MKKILLLSTLLALMTSTVIVNNQTFAATNTKMATKADCKGPCPMGQASEMKKQRCDARKAEFEKRLNLTDKQKAQIKINREKDKAQMKPLMEQIRQKQEAKMEIFKKYEQTDAELIKLNKEIKALKDKKHEIMEQNRKSFESILTKEQKAELQKMKTERENFNKEHKGNRPQKHNMK